MLAGVDVRAVAAPLEEGVHPIATEWWREAVIYQVYTRSFADATGDGVGDLAGVRDRLPYLRDLGIDGLWFNPWYPSPGADNGYDISDYRSIDPAFGTLPEAEGLIADARALGIRTIVDVVPNHVSDSTRGFGRRSPRRRAPPSARASGSDLGAAPTATSRRTSGSRSSAATPGLASPTASGTCTSSHRSSRT